MAIAITPQKADSSAASLLCSRTKNGAWVCEKADSCMIGRTGLLHRAGAVLAHCGASLSSTRQRLTHARPEPSSPPQAATHLPQPSFALAGARAISLAVFFRISATSVSNRIASHIRRDARGSHWLRTPYQAGRADHGPAPQPIEPSRPAAFRTDAARHLSTAGSKPIQPFAPLHVAARQPSTPDC